MSNSVELSTLSRNAVPITSLRPETPNSRSSSVEEGSPIPAESTTSFIPALPPVDRGRDAWLFLISATTVETFVWGFPFSIGILHAYWSSNMFPDQESALTLAATLQTGLMYIGAAFLGPVFTAFPRLQVPLQVIGLVVASASLIGAAFATQAWHLVISLGCFYPFAGALYMPCAILLFEWFHARRGLATGIMYAGTGAGGTIFPFIVSALLSRFGYKATMICFGIGFLALNALALMFIKRRVPVVNQRSEEATGENTGRRRQTMDWSFLKRKTMMIGFIVILMTSFGNFVPSLWIPSWASDVHATSPDGSALVALMNAASVPGNALTGFLSDRVPVRIAIQVSCAIAALACLLLWGFGTNDSMLVAFSLAWGVSGLSFVGLWSKMISIICRDDPTAPALVFSIFATLKGIGNMTSGPISSILLGLDLLQGAAGAYGINNYGVLLIYTGVVMGLGGLTGIFFSEKSSISA